jgi:hypothetical protein
MSEPRSSALAFAAVLFALAAVSCGRPQGTGAAMGPAPGAAQGLEPALAAEEGLSAELAARDAELAALETRLAASAADLAALGEREARLIGQVVELEAELARAQEQRLAREREWLDFTRALSDLELEALPDALGFEVDAELAAADSSGAPPRADAGAAAAAPDPAAASGAEDAAARAAREAEVHRALRSLLAVDGLRGMDLLESGLLGEGWVGPVVFRLVDADGRLSGSLCAERLRLEASHAARTVTLVLEAGEETWRGARTEFERPGPDPRASGVRRVVLPSVDPRPWLEALPELFAAEPVDAPIDDGLWSAALVRGTLNELLRRDAAGGYYKLRELGGVRDDVLRSVHLEGYGADGKLERHLFADRLRVVPQERGILVQLEDGAQMRGEEKAAFLDGRFRIYLPRADPAEWAARGIPGAAQAAPVSGAPPAAGAAPPAGG